MDAFADESGVFGVAGHRQAAHLTYLGLHAQQHRGEVGAGMVVSDASLLTPHHGAGLVQEVFGGPQLQGLGGTLALGQVHGSPGAMLTARPLLARYQGGQVALAMSGAFTNASVLRDELKTQGALFSTLSDGEVLLHLVARSVKTTFVNRLVDALFQLEGAYSLLLMNEDRMVAVRDPRGFRPLWIGRAEGGVVFAEEDGAIRFAGADVRREVEPGEMVVVDDGGMRSVRPFQRQPAASCVHELTGLARSDARVFGRAAYELRVGLGERLATEQPCPQADVVVGVPDSGVPAAVGFSRIARVPFQHGLLRAPFTGRRYVEPSAEVDDFGTPSALHARSSGRRRAPCGAGRGVSGHGHVAAQARAAPP